MQKSVDAGGVSAIRPYAIPVVMAGVAFFVDQATKQYARGLATGEGFFPHILTIVHHQNEGLVANLPVPMPLIVLITVAVLGVLFSASPLIGAALGTVIVGWHAWQVYRNQRNSIAHR